jgi:hypothetical protein
LLQQAAIDFATSAWALAVDGCASGNLLGVSPPGVETLRERNFSGKTPALSKNSDDLKFASQICVSNLRELMSVASFASAYSFITSNKMQEPIAIDPCMAGGIVLKSFPEQIVS